MNSVVYLLVISAKNSLLELKRKPGKLILYLIVVFFIAATAVLSFFIHTNPESYTPIYWLKAVTFAIFSFFAIYAVAKGIASGDSFFDMCDVNLLFVSPVDSRKVLLYGIVKLTKVSFMAGLFILYQANTLKLNFGINFSGVLLILLVFMLCIILLTVLSLLIYNAVNGNAKRKLIAKISTAAVFMPLIIYFIWQLIITRNITDAFAVCAQSSLFKWIPVSGWASEGITAILSGDIIYGAAFIFLILISIILLTLYIMTSKSDYYEDVLCATETAFEKKRLVKDGNINAAVTNRKITVAKTGIDGLGSLAIFKKHLREEFRENRFGFLGLSTIIYIAYAVIFALIMRQNSNIVIILSVLMWMQIFFIGTGRGLKELYMHYIYLIPEPPFTKLIWNNMGTMFKAFVESILIFVAAGLITKEKPIIILCAIVTFTLFSLFLLGLNYLSMRWTRVDISSGMLVMIYIAAVIIIMLPGIIAAVVVAVVAGDSSGTVLGLLVLTLWETIAGLICFGLSKGILHNADMPTVKLGKWN